MFCQFLKWKKEFRKIKQYVFLWLTGIPWGKDNSYMSDRNCINGWVVIELCQNLSCERGSHLKSYFEISGMENGAVNNKSEGLLSRMALNDNKAGMEGLDKDKINKIILESSKVSTSNCGEICTLTSMWVWSRYRDAIFKLTRYVGIIFLPSAVCAGI